MTQPTVFRLGWPAKSALLALALAAVWLVLSRRGEPEKQPTGIGRAASPTAPSVDPKPASHRDTDGPVVSSAPIAAGRPARRDRLQRDAVRQTAYERLGHAPPAPGAPPALPASPGVLSKEYIQARVQSDFVPLAKGCYEALLVSQPQARGKAVVSFTIVGDAAVGGIVESAELAEGSTLKEPEFETCLRESLLSVAFEPPREGGWVSIVYPFEFSPD